MLKICEELFQSFEENSIDYAIVKSVERIDLDTSGKAGDLDILISEKDKQKSEAIMSEVGFKKVLFPSEFNGLGFFVGYDVDSRRQILLHIHNKLRIGTKKSKELHLKIEEGIFKNKVFNQKYKVYTTNPEYEYEILLIRMVLKKSHKKDDLERLNELAKILKSKNLKSSAFMEEIFDKEMQHFLEVEYTKDSILKLHKKYRGKIRRHLSRSIKEKFLIKLRIINGFWIYIVKIFFKILGFPPYIIRRFGKLVAFQGVDGSGKSTQIDYLLDMKYLHMTGVKRIYGGNNEYWIPGLTRACKFFENKEGPLSKMLRLVISVFSIIDRRLRLFGAFFHMLKGKIVVFDRYFYDDLTYKKKIDSKESKISRIVKKVLMSRLGYVPHMTIFLDIDAEDAYKRKQDYSFDKVENQIEAYREILVGREEVQVVDASKKPGLINQEIMELMNNL